MELRRQSPSKFGTPSAPADSNTAYQLLFNVRFDVPFPFYDDEAVPRGLDDEVGNGNLEKVNIDRSYGLQPEPISAVTSMLPVRDTILNKVCGLRRGAHTEAKRDADTSANVKVEKLDNFNNKSVRRRVAVFDHHDVHPDWADKDNDSHSITTEARNAEARPAQHLVEARAAEQTSTFKHRPVQQFHSMRLPETRNRGLAASVGDVSGGRVLDRTQSASARNHKLASSSKIRDETTQSVSPTTPNSRHNAGSDGFIAMSDVNRMRIDRLANALRALERTGSPQASEPFGRTQSMRTNRRQLPEIDFGPIDYSDAEFRRRTSSVPPRCEEMKKTRNHEGRALRPAHSPPHLEKARRRTGAKPHQNDTLSPSSTDVAAAYQRMRTFTMDPSKGAVVNRGDSFRRRSNSGAADARVPVRGQQQQPAEVGGQRCQSPATQGLKNSPSLSSRSHSPLPLGLAAWFSPAEPASPACRVSKYNIIVVGLEGVGKTSVVNQFMTSEYCNPFQNESGTDLGTVDNKVTVILNGEESQLTFIEVDNQKSDLSPTLCGAGYIVVYSIDDGVSFENAKQVLFQLRLQKHSADRPIILVGNKMDLERKRIVPTEQGKAAAKENDCKFVEIAVALGHHVDELLVAILAQVRRDNKRSPVPERQTSPGRSADELYFENSPVSDLRIQSNGGSSCRSSTDSIPARALHPARAIRRSSTRRVKQLQMSKSNVLTTSCSNLTAVGHKLADKVFGRRRSSRSLEDLLSVSK